MPDKHVMTQPRRILPGTTYFVTRRCSERRFLLRPDNMVHTVMLFCLAMAAELTGVRVHAYVVMSNHYHLVVTDFQGLLPKFMAWLNRHSGHCLKLHRRRDGDFWESAEKYSAIELTTAEAVWDKLAYVVANPAAANLVDCAKDWPGLVSLPESALSETREVDRPGLYFRPSGPVKHSAKIRLSIPPILGDISEECYVGTWNRLVGEKEALAREARAGRNVLGKQKVCRTSPFAKPRIRELRRKRNPALAAITREAMHQASKELREFRNAHHLIYQSLRKYGFSQRSSGSMPLVFPAGTWWWVQYGGFKAAPA